MKQLQREFDIHLGADPLFDEDLVSNTHAYFDQMQAAAEKRNVSS